MVKKLNKVIVIGIDGIPLDLIKKWVGEGKLPNFKNIIDKGTSGILKSTMPPISCPAWLCLYCGINPTKIGVYDFRKYYPKEKKYAFFNRSMNEYPFFWEDINKKFFGFNMRMTFPPKESDQQITCGALGTPSEFNFTYPDSIKKEISQICNFRFYQISEQHQNNLIVREKEIFRALYQNTKLYKYFFIKKEWDIFAATFGVSDQVQHFFWKFMNKEGRFRDTIYNIYKKFDELIGWTIKQQKKANLIVVSDHGQGEYYGKVYINDYLIEDGLLKLKSQEKKDIFYYISKIGITGKNLEKIASRLKVNKLLAHILPRKFMYIFKLEKNKKTFEESIIKNLIDWDNTIAYAPTGNTVYINRRGIENNNISYKKAVEKVIEILEKVFDNNITKHMEINKDDDGKPDIIFDSFHYGYECSDYITDNHVKREGRKKGGKSGTHRMDGVIMAYGPDIKKAFIHANIQDIAPTVLHMLDEEIPEYMDGKVLRDIFNSKKNHY